jgi:GDP-D-mannose dehydratase
MKELKNVNKMLIAGVTGHDGSYPAELLAGKGYDAGLEFGRDEFMECCR